MTVDSNGRVNGVTGKDTQAIVRIMSSFQYESPPTLPDPNTARKIHTAGSNLSLVPF